MIGDIVIAIRLGIKQLFCLHEYKEKTINTYPPRYYAECKKCERVK